MEKKKLSEVYREVDDMLEEEDYLSKINTYYSEYNEMCENGELEDDLTQWEFFCLESRLSKMYNEYLDKIYNVEDL